MLTNIEIKIIDKDLYPEGSLTYAKDGDCAVDLRAVEDAVIKPGDTVAMRCGFALHTGSLFPEGKAGMDDVGVACVIIPRSGSVKTGIALANTAGLVDEGYQGEIQCYIFNKFEQETKKEIVIKRGDRIAQMMFLPIIRPTFRIVEEFTQKTERGDSGFGSTGAQ